MIPGAGPCTIYNIYATHYATQSNTGQFEPIQNRRKKRFGTKKYEKVLIYRENQQIRTWRSERDLNPRVAFDHLLP